MTHSVKILDWIGEHRWITSLVINSPVSNYKFTKTILNIQSINFYSKIYNLPEKEKKILLFMDVLFQGI